MPSVRHASSVVGRASNFFFVFPSSSPEPNLVGIFHRSRDPRFFIKIMGHVALRGPIG